MNDFDDIKFNDADEHNSVEECLAEVDYKCPNCNEYMRESATLFYGQRDMIIECETCNYKKSI